jgi:hypothetical protein
MHTHYVRVRMAAAASVFMLAACGGGGGGGPATNIVTSPSGGGTTSTSGTSGSGTVTTNFTQATLGSGSTDTNAFGAFTTGSVAVNPASGFAIAPPAAATVGTNAAPSPTGGSVLTGSAFPLKQTVLSITSSGVAPDTAANNGGATLSVVNWNAAGDSQFRLTIPGVGLDATFTSASLLKGPSTVMGGTFRLTSSNVNYAALGLWEVDTTSNTAGGTTDGTIHVGAFTTGYETPVGGMPKSGTAIYSGVQNVAGLVTTNLSSGGIGRAALLGDGAFSANFSTGAITGGFTNMMVTSGTGVTAPTPWNNVSVTSSLISGTSHFSGSTAAASTPGTPYAVSGSATGRIDGGFYGPTANELGAVWSLSDGASAVIGTAQGTLKP